MSDVPTAAMDARERRREQRAEDNRRQILDTAEIVFGELGYFRTSLRAVAERCELSVGSLYNFFEGKDALYQAILRRREHELHELMRETATSEAPGLEVLRQLAETQIEFFRQHPSYGRLAIVPLAPGGRDAGLDVENFREGFSTSLQIQIAVVTRGQQDGSVRSGDPRALARVFSALVAAFHLMDPATSPYPEDFGVDEVLTLITATFRAV